MKQIPRVIHYCWFGGEPYPPLVQQCMESWKQHLPEYVFRKWDESNAPLDIPFVAAAFKEKKWAFVSDYVRLYALAKEGGIYLDTDMLLVKDLDPFHQHACFLGAEDEQTINASILGAIPHHWFIEACRSFYENSSYDPERPCLIPEVCTEILASHGLSTVHTITRISDIVLYPAVYFYPMPFRNVGGVADWASFLGQETVAVHLWQTSWHTEWQLIAAGSRKEGKRRIMQHLKSTPSPPFRYYLKAFFYLSEAYQVRKKWNEWWYSLFKTLLRYEFVRFILLPFLSYDQKWQLIPPEGFFPKDDWREINRAGIQFRVNRGEHNGWRIFFDLFPKSVYQVFEQIQPNAIILDVGANIGYYTLHFAQRARNGEVIAFEPFEANCRLLKEQVQKNKFTNIRLVPAALGNETGKVSLIHLEERNTGMVWAAPGKGGQNEVSILTLDEFFYEEEIEQVDLIKVDIEGFEMNFLRGAESTLSRFKPVLLMELADSYLRRSGSSAREVLQFLEALNYEVRHASSRKVIHSGHCLFQCFFDIIAISKDESVHHHMHL